MSDNLWSSLILSIFQWKLVNMTCTISQRLVKCICEHLRKWKKRIFPREKVCMLCVYLWFLIEVCINLVLFIYWFLVYRHATIDTYMYIIFSSSSFNFFFLFNDQLSRNNHWLIYKDVWYCSGMIFDVILIIGWFSTLLTLLRSL